MGWEKRGNHRYYYRKRRIGGRVVSEYLSLEAAVELIVQMGDDESQKRDLSQAARRERQKAEAIEGELARLTDLADALTQAVLIAGGCHTHKRQWRRKRG